MGYSESFTFITILIETFKLLSKNLKQIATITTISVTILSSLILLPSYAIQFLPNDLIMLRVWLLIVFELILLLSIFALSIFSRISTVLISATSYTGNNILLKDLFPIVKSTYKHQIKTTSNVSLFTILYSILLATLSIITVILPNFTTMLVLILLGIIGTVIHLYFSVDPALAVIVSVIENECYGAKAVERAQELVQGQRVDGFLMTLILNFVGVIPFGGYWVMNGNQVLMDMDFTMLTLFVVNYLYLFQVLILVAYTAFYFLCKKNRGEEMIGYVQYTKLPNEQMENDIP